MQAELYIIKNFSKCEWYEPSHKNDKILHQNLIDLFLRLDDKERVVISFLLNKFIKHHTEEISQRINQLILDNEDFFRKSIFVLCGLKDAFLFKSSGFIGYLLKLALLNYDIEFVECDSVLNIERIVQDCNDIDRIIFVDDFIGTADTAINVINQAKQKINKYKEFEYSIISIIITEEAYNNLEQINIKNLVYSMKISKSITDSDLTLDKKKEYKQIIYKITNNNYLDIDYALGYGDSEVLYSGINTPDNTFIIFWSRRDKNGKKFPAIFPRKSK